MAEPISRSIEIRLARLLAVIACVALGGVLLILPYRLYERDIRHASEEAHRVSSVASTAIARTLQSGGDVHDLLNRFQEVADFEIQLEKLANGAAHPASETRRGSSELDGTDLTYVATPILDAEGGTWLVTMHFDLAPMKRESIRLIVDLVLLVALGSLGFSIAVFWMIRSSLVVPLHRVTRRIARFEESGEAIEMPEFQSVEMRSLAEAIERACHARTSTS